MEVSKQIALLTALFIGVYAQASDPIDTPTKLGATLKLTCSFPYDYRNIVWRKNEEVLAVGPHPYTRNPRVRPIENGVIEIQDVQQNDLGEYVCDLDDGTLSNVFNVHLEMSPEQLLDKSCRLECSNVNRQLEDILNRLEGVIEGIRQLESRQDRLEYYIRTQSVQRPEPTTKAQPIYTPHPVTQKPATPKPIPITHKHKPETQRPKPVTPPPVPETKENNPTAKQKVVKGKSVYEYLWVVRNFQSEVNKANSDNSYMLKAYFLSKIPGYNVTARLYPNRGGNGFIGLYVGVAPGIYDDLLPWPFKQHIEMGLVSHHPSKPDKSWTIKPFISNCDNKAFEKKTTDDGASCGSKYVLNHKDLNQSQHVYLKNGRLHIRFRISDVV